MRWPEKDRRHLWLLLGMLLILWLGLSCASTQPVVQEVSENPMGHLKEYSKGICDVSTPQGQAQFPCKAFQHELTGEFFVALYSPFTLEMFMLKQIFGDGSQKIVWLHPSLRDVIKEEPVKCDGVCS